MFVGVVYNFIVNSPGGQGKAIMSKLTNCPSLIRLRAQDIWVNGQLWNELASL